VNTECFTADEEHDFNFQAKIFSNCNGGKKKLGFPGYTSRSGLQFLSHVLPFPKGESASDRKKIRHKHLGTSRVNLHYACRTTTG